MKFMHLWLAKEWQAIFRTGRCRIQTRRKLRAESLEERILLAVFDVTDYGAIADDGLDDLAAINAAINAASAGDTVFLPTGSFSITGSIRAKSGVIIEGAGRDSTTITRIAGGGGSMIDLNSLSNVQIASLTLDGSGSALFGIDGSNGSGHDIHDNRIQNLVGIDALGIRFSGAGGTYNSGVTDSRIVDNQFSNIGVGSAFGGGVRMAWGSSRNQVIGNTVANAGRGGIFGNDGSTDLVIKNNTVTGSGSGGTGLGIEVWNGCDRALIENNTVDQWLSVDRSSQVAVRNNTVNGGFLGLELAGGHDNVFTDNTVIGADIGISVSDPNTPKERVLWAHNSIHGSGSWGAQISSEQSAGAVRQMYFYNNAFQGSAQAGFRFHPNYPVGTIENVTLDGNTITGNSYGLTAGDWGPRVQPGAAPNRLDKLTVINNTISNNSLAAFSGSMGTPAGDDYMGNELRWAGNTVTGNGVNNQQTSMGTFFNSPPAVSIVAPASVALGVPVNFSLNYSGPQSIDNVLWDLGDGLPGIVSNPSHSYSQVGTYRVGLVVWDALGRSAHHEVTINVTQEALTINPDVDSFAENSGPQAATLTVTRVASSDLAQPLAVDLASSLPTRVSVPNQVLIPAGQASVTVAVSAIDNHRLDGDEQVTITATANGLTGTTTLTVLDHETLSLTFAHNSVPENGGPGVTTGTVTRSNVDDLASNTPAAGPLIVTLQNSDTSELQVPLQVTIPAGQMSVTFTVDAVDDSLRDGTQTVTVSASAAGFVTGSNTLDVLNTTGIRIDVLAAAVPENAGPGATQVRVHRTDTDAPFDFVTTQTFGVDTSRAILDRDTIISSVQVPAQLSHVTDVDVTISIEHAWLADLDVFLRGPAGQRVELFTDLISNGNALTGTILDEESPTSILDGAAPYTGRFRPERSLDIFDGLNPAGFWTLEVTDDNNFDTGTLLSWALTLTTAGLAPITVTLASSDTTEATVPQQVLIPANQSEVLVPLNAIDDTILDGTQRVTISATSASFPGLALGSDTVDVTDHELLALTLHAASISEAAGANAATGRVTRQDTNLSATLTVVLSSSDTTELTVPATVLIPAGSAFVDFPINAVDDALADGPQIVTITASHAGYSNAPAANITVTDFEPALALNTPMLSVAENAGSVQITVTRQDVQNLSQPLTVQLSSSDTTELTVPASVFIPFGQASVTFSATIVDDTLLDGPQPVTVSATATGIVAGQLQMTVTDHETLTLTVNRPVVTENAGSAAATGTVIRGNTNLGTALVVTLSSSDLTELTVPATVTIPAGQSSATFSINAVNDLILDGTQLVTLTASAANYTADTAQVAVDDHEPPVITLPAAVTALPRPLIQWNAIPGAARYEIWLNNLSTGQQVSRTDQLTTSQYTPTHDLAIGRYALWVRAFDAQGQSSVWSNTHRFRVDTPPMITAPSGTPGEMAPATFPLISWTAVAGAHHYDVWVDNLTTGQSQVIRQPVVNGTSFQALVSPGSGTYKAWVRAFNGTNETSRWSSPRTFVVLAAPVVVSPAGDTFDTTPTFAWTPISGATHYELLVRSLENSATALRDQHVTATSLTAQFDLPAGRYGVWVRAFSNSTFSAWSQQQNFAIAQPPRVTSPTGTLTGANLPEFTWTALDQTARYELWVSQDFAGGGSQRVIYETSLTTNSFTPTTPLGPGTYRVWVRAISTRDVTTGWSAAETFTVGPVASVAPNAFAGDVRSRRVHPASAGAEPAAQSEAAALHDTVMAAWSAEEWWIRN